MQRFANILAAVLMVTGAASAQVPDEKEAYDTFVREQEQGTAQEEESFRRYSAEVTRQFDEYVAEQERLFREYTGQIARTWGTPQVRTSTRKEYVAYDAAFSSRSTVDFEKGKAVVEVIMTEAEAKDRPLVERRLREQVAQLAVSRGGTDPLEVKSGLKPESVPLIADQLPTKDGRPVTAQTAAQFAQQTVAAAEPTKESVTGKDGVKRVVIGVQVPLVPDHLKRRASDFRSSVRRDAERFAVDPTLIFAVMHTESFFNPRARSHVPAYGLMQLVPKSGARDAFFFVHKKDSLVTGDYLYTAENNIELGSGYLAKLLTVDFRGVKDPKSRVYCAIAAYNTGPGNVAKAFTGKRNVIQALPKINALPPEGVFDHLKQNLPFEETRSYVAKVSERMGLYTEWTN